MKIKIEYSFEQANRFPFVAMAYKDNKIIEVGSSKHSFDEAKKDLIEKLAVKIKIMPTIIPESEEIEL
jgi:hypothetical protein